MELKCLTTREVARLFRVSDATVKRWQDAGILYSTRTNGGHRRFPAEEIARFQRERGICVKTCNGDESIVKAMTRRIANKHQSECDLFYALVAGCETEAANILIGAYLEGKPLAEIFDEMMCPAMRRVGELWCKGELTITQEHIATRAASSAVHKLRNILPVSDAIKGLAMCCAMEGDFHDLPTHLAQTIFESENWEVLNFGANTPLYCLAEEVLRHAPEIVCITLTLTSDIERLARDYKIFTEEIAALKIPIILGGRAFKDAQIRRRFPADVYARRFSEVVELLRDFSKEANVLSNSG